MRSLVQRLRRHGWPVSLEAADEIERLTREMAERENNVGLAMEAEYLKGYAAGLAEGREDKE